MKLTALAVLLVSIVPVAHATVLRVENETGGWDIEEVYVTPAGSCDWGENLLESEIIADGTASEFHMNPGVYDVMLVDEDGDMYEKFSLNIVLRHVWEVTLDDLTRYASGAVYSGG